MVVPALKPLPIDAVDPAWIVAITWVVVAWYVSRVVARRLRPRLEADLLRPSVANAVLVVGRAVVVLFALAPVATLVGFRPRDVLLSVTLLSVIVGAIVVPVARSYVGGLFVLFDRPYEIGDLIEVPGPDGGFEHRGFVEDVTLRYTRLLTVDNAFVVIPNESIRTRDVKNLSGEDERCRERLAVTVTYEGEVGRARTLLERAARGTDGVVSGGPDIRLGSARYPAGPMALIDGFGDHGVALTLVYWIEEPYREPAIRSAVQANVRERFAGADGVGIAYPHVHHVFDGASEGMPVDLSSGDLPDRSAAAGWERSGNDLEE